MVTACLFTQPVATPPLGWRPGHRGTPGAGSAPGSDIRDAAGRCCTAVRQAGSGEILPGPLDVVLSDYDVVQPDLVFISSARSSIVTETHIHGAPDLVIEICTEQTRKTDEIIKRKLYERHGVKEYWIVDPELETVTVYRTTKKGYARTAELSREGNDAVTTSLLPELQLALAAIFE